MSSPFVRTQPSAAPRPALSAFQRPAGTSFLVHTGLAGSAWLLGAATGRPAPATAAAWLRPAAPAVDAWYQAVGIPVLRYGLPLSVALRGLTWRQSLLLGGVTTWSARLLYQLLTTPAPAPAARATQAAHPDAPSWPSALVTRYLPAVLLQAALALPLVAPFRTTRVALAPWGWSDAFAVFAFATGFALDALADAQQAAARAYGARGVYRDGVWSIVRNPNYLGDALLQLSFPLLALNTPAYHPVLFLGPALNLVHAYFAASAAPASTPLERYDEYDPASAAQAAKYRRETNAFWPAPGAAVGNVWTWVVLGAGAAGVVLEKTLRTLVVPAVL